MKVCILSLLITFPICSFSQIITTIGGNGLVGSTGDGGAATAAKIAYPGGGAFDNKGNYYFVTSNTGNSVRKITPDGLIYTVAGTGIAGYGGDNGPATAAQLKTTQAIAVDAYDNLYIADAGNNRVRKVNAADGIITTIAGTGAIGYGGDGGQATSAKIYNPLDVCFDKTGNLYIADYGNARVRKVNTSGIITTVVGTGVIYNSAGGGLADTTPIFNPSGICVDGFGNLYIANWHSRVYKVNTDGYIYTIAGNGISGYTDGDGIATNASIIPLKICIDKIGKLYIAEYDIDRIRTVTSMGVIATLTGNGVAAFSGDGGFVGSAQVNHPGGVVLDTCSNLYIADTRNFRIRKINFNPTCEPITDVSALKSGNGLSIYPNPTSSILTISSTEKINGINITNTLGQMIYEQQCKGKEQVEMNIAHLPCGVYMVRVNGVHVKRFLKQ